MAPKGTKVSARGTHSFQRTSISKKHGTEAKTRAEKKPKKAERHEESSDDEGNICTEEMVRKAIDEVNSERSFYAKSCADREQVMEGVGYYGQYTSTLLDLDSSDGETLDNNDAELETSTISNDHFHDEQSTLNASNNLNEDSMIEATLEQSTVKKPWSKVHKHKGGNCPRTFDCTDLFAPTRIAGPRSAFVGINNEDDEFPQFPKLPPEVRDQIWDEAANFPRIIEYEAKYGPRYYWYTLRDPPEELRIVNKSRAPPAILHVCRQARTRGLRFYELKCFDLDVRNSIFEGDSIYWNSAADILYFNESHDPRCISYWFYYAPDRVATRIAIHVNKYLARDLTIASKEWDWTGADFFTSWLDAGKAQGGTRIAWDGVKEMFFVMPSRLWQANDSSQMLMFRPSTSDGHSKYEYKVKKYLQETVEAANKEGKLDRSEVEPGCTTVWSATNMPHFQFVNLTTLTLGDGYVCDSIELDRKGFEYLDFHYYSKAIAKETSTNIYAILQTGDEEKQPRYYVCSEAITHHEWPDFYEVGIMGTVEDVIEAKKLLRNMNPNAWRYEWDESELGVYCDGTENDVKCWKSKKQMKKILGNDFKFPTKKMEHFDSDGEEAW